MAARGQAAAFLLNGQGAKPIDMELKQQKTWMDQCSGDIRVSLALLPSYINKRNARMRVSPLPKGAQAVELLGSSRLAPPEVLDSRRTQCCRSAATATGHRKEKT